MLALLGGVLGLDTVSCVQAMISRPIVGGSLAGLLLGDPAAGVWAGALLEIVSLHQLPIGASRHWDTGPASVAAAAALTGLQGPAAPLFAVSAGVLVGWAGSWTVHALRRLNGRLVVKEEAAPMTPRELTARHLSAMALDFFRAAALTTLAVWAVPRIVPLIGPAAERSASLASLALLACLSMALGADVTMMARGRRVWRAFGVGAAVSSLLILWLA